MNNIERGLRRASIIVIEPWVQTGPKFTNQWSYHMLNCFTDPKLSIEVDRIYRANVKVTIFLVFLIPSFYRRAFLPVLCIRNGFLKLSLRRPVGLLLYVFLPNRLYRVLGNSLVSDTLSSSVQILCETWHNGLSQEASRRQN